MGPVDLTVIYLADKKADKGQLQLCQEVAMAALIADRQQMLQGKRPVHHVPRQRHPARTLGEHALRNRCKSQRSFGV